MNPFLTNKSMRKKMKMSWNNNDYILKTETQQKSIYTEIVSNTKAKTLLPIIRKKVNQSETKINTGG